MVLESPIGLCGNLIDILFIDLSYWDSVLN